MNAQPIPERRADAHWYELTDAGHRVLDSVREEDTTPPVRHTARAGWALTPAALELLDGTNG